MGVTDLNMKNHSGHAVGSDIFGVQHVYRPARFFPSDRPPANAYVPALRATLPGRAVCKTLSLSRPVSQHGVRTANLSGEPSRYRSLSARTSKQALSHGHPLQGRAQHALRCQRTTRLAYLCRLCPSLDPNRTASVRRGRPGPRTRQHRLRTRCVNHRSLSFRISLGIVPIHKICGQTSYPAGSAWQHPNLYTYLRWQTARCQCTRHSSARSRCLLHHGSGLCGFRTALHITHGKRLLRHPCQIQHPVSNAAIPGRWTNRLA